MIDKIYYPCVLQHTCNQTYKPPYELITLNFVLSYVILHPLLFASAYAASIFLLFCSKEDTPDIFWWFLCYSHTEKKIWFPHQSLSNSSYMTCFNSYYKVYPGGFCGMILSHVSTSITWSLSTLKASNVVIWPILTCSFMQRC